MSKISSSLLQTLFAKRFLYLTVLAIFIGLSSIAFSVSSQVVEQITENETTSSNAIHEGKQPQDQQLTKTCCAGKPLAPNQLYTLVGTYYSLKDNQNSILMFNNKAPQPLVVNPTFFSMGGERLDLPALTIAATSYQEFDLRELLASAGQQFQEGSVQVTHQGMRQQLGVQVKILKPGQGLIFDEQFIEPAKRFVSSRLESAWWLPSPQSETKFIVSNTTDLPVTATIKVDGTAPQQQQSAAIQLNPHQTRVIDILRDLVGHQNGTLHKEGGISINHSGTPGAILARIFVSKESTGFSTVINFNDPQAPVSSKWHGSGYRLGRVGNEELTPILVARNVGSEPSAVSGRLSYTNDASEVVFVNVPTVNIAANETKSIDVEQAVRQSNVPANVTDTGFEFEYSTPKGSVIMTALSVSRSGNHVFQVPLFDPGRMGVSAGGYPWKAESDYTTKLYIKNETNQPQKYTVNLFYEGGGYTLGVKDIKANQLVAIDFRQLRDNQTPDANGKRIPLNIERGQIGWSSKSKTPRALSGRSHQSSISEGVSSTYDCRNHCIDTYYDSWLTSDYYLAYVNEVANYAAYQRDVNSYGNILQPYRIDYPNWGSTDSTVAGINSYGSATALGVGTSYIQGSWFAERRVGEVGYEECVYETITALAEEFVDVAPILEIYRNNQRITGTTQNVIVGQQIYLIASVLTGPNDSISSRQWTIPGEKKVADYEVVCNESIVDNQRVCTEPTSGTVTPLTNLSENEIRYYWVDGGDGRQVQFTITVNGRQYSKTVTFNVKRPTATVTSVTDIPRIINTGEGEGLYFGGLTMNGISFSANNVQIPTGFSGQFQWVQIWNKNRRYERIGSEGNVTATAVGTGLDSIYPYQIGYSAFDSPGLAFDPIYRRVTIDESYRMFFMFRPTGLSEPTIPVPLQVVDWGWYGDASSQDGINWVLNPNSKANSPNPRGVDTTDHPQWNRNAYFIPFRLPKGTE